MNVARFADRPVMVTGHTGFIGSWLCSWLDQLGARVSGLALNVPSTPALFPLLKLNHLQADIRADIRDAKAVYDAVATCRPRLVFHLAAQPLVRRGYDFPIETLDTNIMGTAYLLEAVRALVPDAVVVVFTSDKAYRNLYTGRHFKEDDPLGGADPYSASKACADILAACYDRAFFRDRGVVTMVRAGNVIGGGDWAEDRLVPDCMRAWSQGETVLLRNPGFTRPWQHVLEAVWGMIAIADAAMADEASFRGAAFNLGPSPEAVVDVATLVELLAGHYPGAEVERTESDHQKVEAPVLSLDPSAIQKRLGWRTHLSLAETAAWTTSWYRNYYSGPRNSDDFTRKQIEDYRERLT